MYLNFLNAPPVDISAAAFVRVMSLLPRDPSEPLKTHVLRNHSNAPHFPLDLVVEVSMMMLRVAITFVDGVGRCNCPLCIL